MKTLSKLNLTSFISTFIFVVTTTFIYSIINTDLIIVKKIKENHSVPIIYDKFKDNKNKNYKTAYYYYYQPKLKKACFNQTKKDVLVNNCNSNERVISSKEPLIFNNWRLDKNPFIQKIEIFTYDYYYKNNYLLKNISLCTMCLMGLLTP